MEDQILKYVAQSIHGVQQSISNDLSEIRKLVQELVGQVISSETQNLVPDMYVGPTLAPCTLRQKPSTVELDRFHGVNPKAWIFQAERYFKFHGIAETHKLSVASFYLDDDALKWFQWLHRNGQFIDWKHFTEKLIIHFQNHNRCATCSTAKIFRSDFASTLDDDHAHQVFDKSPHGNWCHSHTRLSSDTMKFFTKERHNDDIGDFKVVESSILARSVSDTGIVDEIAVTNIIEELEEVSKVHVITSSMDPELANRESEEKSDVKVQLQGSISMDPEYLGGIDLLKRDKYTKEELVPEEFAPVIKVVQLPVPLFMNLDVSESLSVSSSYSKSLFTIFKSGARSHVIRPHNKIELPGTIPFCSCVDNWFDTGQDFEVDSCALLSVESKELTVVSHDESWLIPFHGCEYMLLHDENFTMAYEVSSNTTKFVPDKIFLIEFENPPWAAEFALIIKQPLLHDFQLVVLSCIVLNLELLERIVEVVRISNVSYSPDVICLRIYRGNLEHLSNPSSDEERNHFLARHAKNIYPQCGLGLGQSMEEMCIMSAYCYAQLISRVPLNMLPGLVEGLGDGMNCLIPPRHFRDLLLQFYLHDASDVSIYVHGSCANSSWFSNSAIDVGIASVCAIFALIEREYDPFPKGEVHIKKEIVSGATFHALDAASAQPPRDILPLMSPLMTPGKTEITDKLWQKMNKVVYDDEGVLLVMNATQIAFSMKFYCPCKDCSTIVADEFKEILKTSASRVANTFIGLRLLTQFQFKLGKTLFVVTVCGTVRDLYVWDPGVNSKFMALTGHTVNVEPLLLLGTTRTFCFITYANSMTQVWDPGRRWCMYFSSLLSTFPLVVRTSLPLQWCFSMVNPFDGQNKEMYETTARVKKLKCDMKMGGLMDTLKQWLSKHDA